MIALVVSNPFLLASAVVALTIAAVILACCLFL